MELKLKRKIAILVVPQIALLLLPQDASACRLWDRLFRRRAATTAYSPAACNTCSDGSYCEQTVVQYVPQVAYRTVWQPVPVTTYKRTVSCNPMTGLPIECTKPCTTYSYQARRVPYTTYRPVYGKVPVCNTASTTAYQPISNCAATTAYVPPAPCNSCAPNALAGTTTPYYSTPSYTSPGYQQPGYSNPYSNGQPTPATPNSGIADPNANPNNPPRLSPEIGSSNVRRLPSTGSSRYSTSLARANDSYYSGRSDVAMFSSEDRNKSTSSPPAYTKLSRSADAFIEEQRTRSVSTPSLDESLNELESRRNLLELKPLPDNDRDSRIEVPPMLNVDGNQTVARPMPMNSRYTAKKIEWPRVVQASYVRNVSPNAKLEVKRPIEVRRLPTRSEATVEASRGTSPSRRRLPTKAELEAKRQSTQKLPTQRSSASKRNLSRPWAELDSPSSTASRNATSTSADEWLANWPRRSK